MWHMFPLIGRLLISPEDGNRKHYLWSSKDADIKTQTNLHQRTCWQPVRTTIPRNTLCFITFLYKLDSKKYQKIKGVSPLYKSSAPTCLPQLLPCLTESDSEAWSKPSQATPSEWIPLGLEPGLADPHQGESEWWNQIWVFPKIGVENPQIIPF